MVYIACNQWRQSGLISGGRRGSGFKTGRSWVLKVQQMVAHST